MIDCPVCKRSSKVIFYIEKDGIDFFDCDFCGSIYANPEFIGHVDNGRVENYSNDYWQNEVVSSRERSYGSTLVRFAELFIYARVEILNFLDIGTGPDFFLDACDELLPKISSNIYGVELYPPPIHSSSKNYISGSLADLKTKYDAGICIEVIEHLTPMMLDNLARDLSRIVSNQACFYFNSVNPDYVKKEGGGYLDPKIRGHIVSYSIKGLKVIFEKYGFKVIPIPGRDFGFLLEFQSSSENFISIEDRINNPLPINLKQLKSEKYGEMFYAMGLESARC